MRQTLDNPETFPADAAGLCKTAWMQLPPARTRVARWLRKVRARTPLPRGRDSGGAGVNQTDSAALSGE